MTDLDHAEFLRGVGAIIRDALEPLKAENAALVKRIEELESRPVEKGDPGPPGDPGQDAEPVLVADVVAELVKTDVLAPVLDLYAAQAVAKHFEEHPVENGKDAPPVSDEQIDSTVRKYLEANPPKDGKSVTVEDIAIFMEAAVSKWALEFERRASDTLTRAIDKIPTPKDGADFTETSFDYDGERTLTIRGKGGDIVKRLPVPIDRGYYRDGMKAEKGDILTHDGNAWIALKDTSAKPCTENKEDWRLFARRGRDGRDGKDGKAPPGPVKLGNGNA